MSDNICAKLSRMVDRLAGIDSCRAGWVVATADCTFTRAATVAFQVVDQIAPVLDAAAASESYVGIDIPIGIPSSSSRDCDLAARQLLGAKRASSVFPVPARSTLGGTSYEECCALNVAASGTRLSKQTQAIIPKIIEVDRWMTPERQTRIREVHPEVCFCRLNQAPLLHGKKTAEGQAERLAILRRLAFIFDPYLERSRLGSSRVAVDDLIDAAVAMLTAFYMSRGEETVLGGRARDGRGLLMEIVA